MLDDGLHSSLDTAPATSVLVGYTNSGEQALSANGISCGTEAHNRIKSCQKDRQWIKMPQTLLELKMNVVLKTEYGCKKKSVAGTLHSLSW